MPLTLEQALDTSAALEERIASVVPAARDALEQKKAMVDFLAFGLFKQAGVGEAAPYLKHLGKGLAWGTGFALPALGVGHLLAKDVENQGEDLVNHARNQALLAALGIGGASAIGSAVNGLMNRPPKQREETNEYTFPNNDQAFGRNVVKFSEDATLQKLAAVILLDNVLEDQLAKAASDERADIEECLYLNRSCGTALLRKLR